MPDEGGEGAGGKPNTFLPVSVQNYRYVVPLGNKNVLRDTKDGRHVTNAEDSVAEDGKHIKKVGKAPIGSSLTTKRTYLVTKRTRMAWRLPALEAILPRTAPNVPRTG